MSDGILKLIQALSPDQRRTLARLLEQPKEPIAVVGMGCRLPSGIRGPDAFWNALANGVDAVSEPPADRWDVEALCARHPDRPGVRYGGFVPDIDKFDPDFFNVNRHEAAWMDPQQRMVLEVAWEALEDAGQVPRELAGTHVGVFIGISASEYMQQRLRDDYQAESYVMAGASHALVANRLSYFLDLRGPSMALDTACSSSLTALHLACQSLLSGESDLAIAGGVNLVLSPAGVLGFADLGGVAGDGRCKPFDARADGMIRSEGCGIVVLRRLADARAHGDPIRALIRGSAINQDGRSTRLTAPNPAAQVDVIRRALARAAVEPHDVSYIEAHGTGTSLGDPIEVEALTAVYGKARTDGSECVLGSVKANLGHLESAAGAAGLLKVLLCLEHDRIPEQIHFRALNPNMTLDGTPFVVPRAQRAWPRRKGARIAAVSSFGMGGANAHAILEEAGPDLQSAPAAPKETYVLPLSAQSEDSLRATAASYSDYLQNASSTAFADICFTAAARRDHHDHRIAVVARDASEAANRLAAWSRGERFATAASGRLATQRRPGLVFVFSGWGSLWPGMSRQLFAEEPAFREAFVRCAEALAPHSKPFSLLERVRTNGVDHTQADWGFAEGQTAIFAMSVALAALFRSWGVVPDAVIGHSMGEVAAAHVAGILSLEDAALVICRRSQLLAGTGEGAMAVIGLSESETREWIAPYGDALYVAVCNSPVSTVISGEPAAVDDVVAALEKEGDVFCRRVKDLPIAAHSPRVDAARARLVRDLQGVRPRAGTIPSYSSVLGGIAPGLGCDAAYWGKNLREPVLFSAAAQRALDDGHGFFLELSPHPILLASLEECLRVGGHQGLTFSSMRRDAAGREALLSTVGSLYAAGHDVRWSALYPGGRSVRLPRYAWRNQRYWIDRPARTGGVDPVWEITLDLEKLPFLADHAAFGEVVFPAAGYLELALDGARRGGLAHAVAEGVELLEALVLGASPIRLRVALSSEGSGTSTFRISSAPAAEAAEARWTVHAQGSLRAVPASQASQLEAVSLDPIRQRCPRRITSAEHYARAAQSGLHYGPTFRGVREIVCQEGEALALVESVDEGWARLDACIQAAIGIVSSEQDETASYLPMHIDAFRLHARPGARLWSHAKLREDRGADKIFDVRVFTDDGVPVLALEGLRAKRVERRGPVWLDWLHVVRWRPQALPAKAAIPTHANGRWLLVGDDEPGGVCQRLLARFQAVHQPAVLAGADDELLRSRFASSPWLGIVYVLAQGKDVAASRERILGAFRLAASVARDADAGTHPRVWFVTAGAQALDAGQSVTASEAPLVGLGRSLAWEHPALRSTRVDLGAAPSEHEIDGLFDELRAGDREDEIALRGTSRYVARLGRYVPSMPASEADRALVHGDATYLVTGGLGGLGLTVAAWLVERGARHLVLSSRNADGARVEAPLDAMRARGARIELAQADVASRDDVARVLRHIDAGMPPLRGIVHAAGTLADGLVTSIDEARFEEVARPKIDGASNLARVAQERPLDFLVFFSSAASLIGAAAQTNYAAANAFMDTLAHDLRRRGIPALSINWGPWSHVGLAAGDAVRRHMDEQGIGSIAPEQGTAILEALLRSGAAQVGVIPFQRAPLRPPSVSLFAGFGDAETTRGARLQEELQAALPEARRTILSAYVTRCIAPILNLPLEELNPDKPLVRFGLDSLMAVKMKNALESEPGISVSVARLFQGAAVRDLTDDLLAQLLGGEAVSRAPAPAENSARKGRDRLKEMRQRRAAKDQTER